MKYLISILLLLNISLSYPTMQEKISLNGNWLFKADPKQYGLKHGYFKTNYDRKNWELVELPKFWDNHSSLINYDGWGWYAKEFFIDDVSKDLAIYFEGIDDEARIWINGKEIGNHAGYNEAFYFDLKEKLVHGKNLIVVQVIDYGGPGGIYKPVFIIESKDIEKYLKDKYAELTARKSADWVQEAIIYSVYLRSFSSEGTFKALEKKIPELKELGVTVIWLLPIHPVGKIKRKGTLGSPYSVQDYYAVNSEFGTLEDFKSLVQTIHTNGLKIIIDLVANHTSWDSELIKKHPEWFTKNSEGKIISPNSDWTDVADLDYSNKELWNYMIEMMKWWIKEIDIDGFRCDVAELVPTEFWEAARDELNQIKPIMMLSEGSLPEHHLKAFDITYSWNVYDKLEPLIKGKSQAKTLDEIFKKEGLRFPKGSLRLRFNTNHDKNAWDMPAVRKFGIDGLKLSAVLINTIPGIPLLYNGEEVANDKRLDLFEKVEINWKKKTDMYDLYKTLFSLRKKHRALVDGTFQPIEVINSSSVYAFLRRKNNEKILVVLNFSDKTQKPKLKLNEGFQIFENILTNEVVEIHKIDTDKIQVSTKAFGYYIFELK
ncbi:MAG: 1,4-alpha-glucan branching enzyme [Ignavibacteriae bacterium]|nr:MAG: 1,4-alpha-glucan branching enzyme [Ignavibacteriota bacterium]